MSLNSFTVVTQFARGFNEKSSVFKTTKHSYLRSVLTTMVDRAEDELFKEALLIYSFLCTNKMTVAESFLPEKLAEITEGEMEEKVEENLNETSLVNSERGMWLFRLCYTVQFTF